MTFTENWSLLEPDLKTVFAHEADPLQALAEARTPGIVLRGAYNPDHCPGGRVLSGRGPRRTQRRGWRNRRPGRRQENDHNGTSMLCCQILFRALVAYRRNRGEWVACMPMATLLGLLEGH